MLALDHLREVAPGIFYSGHALVTADEQAIAFLKAAALATPARRARLCAHGTPEDVQHDMLIVSHTDTYVAPHRHVGRCETMLVVEGEAEALVFEDDGRLATLVRMGAATSGQSFFYRMPEGRFHSLRIHSEFLVFVESTLGPFRPHATEYAPWAPGPNDAGAGRVFLDNLSSADTD